MKIRFQDAPNAAEESRGLHVDYVAAKRNIPAWRWNLIVLLVVSPALYLVGTALLDQIWISARGIVEMKETRLHAGQGGQVGFILPPGSRVDAGTTLATITPVQLEMTSKLGETLVPHRAERSSRAGLLKYRRDRAHRYQQLWQQGAATQAELATALEQLAQAEADYGSAAGQGSEKRSSSQQGRIDHIRIAAPTPGIVAQVSTSVGDWVVPGAELLSVVNDRESRVIAYLDPRHMRYAERGRSARVKFADGTTLNAQVEEIRATTGRLPAGQSEPPRSGNAQLQLVLLPNEELPLRYRKQGLPVEVYFDFDFQRFGFGRP